jgi:LacI family transcriptional regulator, fructose operon transcriptional repressor
LVQIKDVAKHAGVSVASVSRVLAGLPVVSEPTRQRVLESVKALDYRPDLAARRLRSRRSDTIGLVVSDIRNPFFTEVSRAVEDVAFSHQMRVILCNTDEDPDKEASCLEFMQDEKVSGVILSPSLKLLSHFAPRDYGFPVVLVDRYERGIEADAILLDNFEAAYRLTDHLITNGHRRIVFIYGSESATGRQRLEGHRAAMTKHQLPVHAEGVRPVEDQAREAVLAVLKRSSPPEAVIASSGLILLGVVEALRETRLNIPRDIAVAGFDNMPWTQLVDPGLTVIAQPTYDMGREAMELLLQRIAMPEKAMRQIILRGELIERGSSVARSGS